MKILIVEDDEDQIAVFEGEFPASGTVDASYARSLETARALLQGVTFDLVVLESKNPDSGWTS